MLRTLIERTYITYVTHKIFFDQRLVTASIFLMPS